MDGLEISEIKYKEAIGIENATQRIDAEYFKSDYIEKMSLLRNLNPTALVRIVRIAGGKRLPLNVNFSEYGIKYARAEDVKDKFLNVDNSPLISYQIHNILSRYVTVYNDVLLTIVGNSIGDVAINKLHETINLTENCVRLYGEEQKVNSYLFCFLLSVYGQVQIKRETVGTAQPKLAIERIRLFKIPEFSDEFYSLIFDCVEESWQKLQCANNVYQNVSKHFEEYISFHQNNEQIIQVKTLSESFIETGRLDAEYYQPKYDALFDALSRLPTENLGGEDGLVFMKKSIEPGSEAYQDEGIPFVRVSDINKYSIVEPAIKLSQTIVPNIESLYPHKDTILLSKDGSVGIAYKVQEDMQIVTSSALLHLTIKDTNQVLPDYLTLVLNSQVVQLQAERDCNGAILQHWKPSDIEKVLIPILDMDKQKEISDKVQESFRLRKEAKRLLDNAIKAVEMAIEGSEQTAIVWLETAKGGN